MAFICSRDSSRSRISLEKPSFSSIAAFSGVLMAHWVEACSGIPRLLHLPASSSPAGLSARSCMIMASAPASCSSSIIPYACSSSWSKMMVFSVAKILAPNLCAYRHSLPISLISFPAACLAPNAGPAIYTASAPQSMAAMPMSAVLAGARSSRSLINCT